MANNCVLAVKTNELAAVSCADFIWSLFAQLLSKTYPYSSVIVAANLERDDEDDEGDYDGQ